MSFGSRSHLSIVFALGLLCLLVVCPPAPAQEKVSATAKDARLDWWRDARFGLFIHWGLYSVPAGEWKDQTGHAEWIRTTAQIPLATYDQFLERFNPTEFDASAWARAAKAAGMRYIVITTKHHDGFCLFDSKETEFDVMATPHGRDILREIADAFRAEGLRVGWYHSIMDWHHPDYLPRRGWEKERSTEGADFERYRRYLHSQVTEILSNYGPIDVMWFDGEWERTWNHEHRQELYDLCRSLQPNVIVNNRVDVGRGGMAGLTEDAKYCGDFGTPEQEVPANGLPGGDGESCITMNRHWGYNRADQDYKSTEELIRLLIDVASKGGNLLLNVGPKADGTFPAKSSERLEGIGRWLGEYGESIYGTEASPLPETPWGRCTMKRVENRTRLYLHVFDWPSPGLVVRGLGNRSIRAFLLNDPDTALKLGHGVGSVAIAMPKAAPHPNASVVVLEFEGPPIVYDLPRFLVASEVFLDEVTMEIDSGSSALAVHYTVDGSEPTELSPRYLRPLRLAESTVVHARSVHDGKPVTEVARFEVKKVAPLPAHDAGVTSRGLERRIYKGIWDRLPEFSNQEPGQTDVVGTVTLKGGAAAEHSGARFIGWITLPADGIYDFALDSDDGSRLWIDNNLVVDNDGLHAPTMAKGTLPLAAGAHRIQVDYFNKTGGAELTLYAVVAGKKLESVAAAWLSH